MRLSQLFTKTRKEAPADEESKNAQLLIRAGFIHKEMAGVYGFLPLGKLVLDKITQIIREEMNSLGGQEILMTTLQNKELWETTGRWDDSVIDNWFKSKLVNGTEVGIGLTHEEPIINMLKHFVSSYKDLPVYLYQFQSKFRNELRAKSGLMRGREFFMKDLYSFSRTKEEHDKFYEEATEAYHRVYDRLGLGDITYTTFASGGYFSKFSHEFQTLSDVGEDTIYVNEQKKVAINQEVYTDDVLVTLGVTREELTKKRAVEVGNIFLLGSKYCDALGLKYIDESGQSRSLTMGCYGIGISRLMGLIAEHFADEKGLVWPENIAPAKVYLARLSSQKEVTIEADKLYEELQNKGVEVLYDDRDDVRPGEKFADADLLGIPHRVVISSKTVESGKVEHKKRTQKDAKMISENELIKLLA